MGQTSYQISCFPINHWNSSSYSIDLHIEYNNFVDNTKCKTYSYCALFDTLTELQSFNWFTFHNLILLRCNSMKIVTQAKCSHGLVREWESNGEKAFNKMENDDDDDKDDERRKKKPMYTTDIS